MPNSRREPRAGAMPLSWSPAAAPRRRYNESTTYAVTANGSNAPEWPCRRRSYTRSNSSNSSSVGAASIMAQQHGERSHLDRGSGAPLCSELIRPCPAESADLERSNVPVAELPCQSPLYSYVSSESSSQGQVHWSSTQSSGPVYLECRSSGNSVGTCYSLPGRTTGLYPALRATGATQPRSSPLVAAAARDSAPAVSTDIRGGSLSGSSVVVFGATGGVNPTGATESSGSFFDRIRSSWLQAEQTQRAANAPGDVSVGRPTEVRSGGGGAAPASTTRPAIFARGAAAGSTELSSNLRYPVHLAPRAGAIATTTMGHAVQRSSGSTATSGEYSYSCLQPISIPPTFVRGIGEGSSSQGVVIRLHRQSQPLALPAAPPTPRDSRQSTTEPLFWRSDVQQLLPSHNWTGSTSTPSAPRSYVVMSRPTGHAGVSEVLESARSAFRGAGRAVPTALINLLPSETFNGSSSAGGLSEGIRTCLVCHLDYDDADELRRLPCLHRFHCLCIDRWFESRATCPICRIPVIEALQLSQLHPAAVENLSGGRGAPGVVPVPNSRGSSLQANPEEVDRSTGQLPLVPPTDQARDNQPNSTAENRAAEHSVPAGTAATLSLSPPSNVGVDSAMSSEPAVSLGILRPATPTTATANHASVPRADESQRPESGHELMPASTVTNDNTLRCDQPVGTSVIGDRVEAPGPEPNSTAPLGGSEEVLRVGAESVGAAAPSCASEALVSHHRGTLNLYDPATPPTPPHVLYATSINPIDHTAARLAAGSEEYVRQVRASNVEVVSQSHNSLNAPDGQDYRCMARTSSCCDDDVIDERGCAGDEPEGVHREPLAAARHLRRGRPTEQVLQPQGRIARVLKRARELLASRPVTAEGALRCPCPTAHRSVGLRSPTMARIGRCTCRVSNSVTSSSEEDRLGMLSQQNTGASISSDLAGAASVPAEREHLPALPRCSGGPAVARRCARDEGLGERPARSSRGGVQRSSEPSTHRHSAGSSPGDQSPRSNIVSLHTESPSVQLHVQSLEQPSRTTSPSRRNCQERSPKGVTGGAEDQAPNNSPLSRLRPQSPTRTGGISNRLDGEAGKWEVSDCSPTFRVAYRIARDVEALARPGSQGTLDSARQQTTPSATTSGSSTSAALEHDPEQVSREWQRPSPRWLHQQIESMLGTLVTRLQEQGAKWRSNTAPRESGGPGSSSRCRVDSGAP